MTTQYITGYDLAHCRRVALPADQCTILLDRQDYIEYLKEATIERRNSLVKHGIHVPDKVGDFMEAIGINIEAQVEQAAVQQGSILESMQAACAAHIFVHYDDSVRPLKDVRIMTLEEVILEAMI